MSASWLDKHLETFVRPYLGHIPLIDPNNHCVQYLHPKALTCLLSVWKEAKKLAGSRQMLLAGRDVWLFEVLARLEDFPTIFRSDISSIVAPHVKEDYTACYLLDTGYHGSVPKAMKIESYGLIKLTSDSPTEKKKHQVFPRMRLIRYHPQTGVPIGGPQNNLENLAGNLECMYKYWTQGSILPLIDNYVYGPWPEPKIVQTLSSKAEFAVAAMTTRLVANHWKEVDKRKCASSFSTTKSMATAPASLPHLQGMTLQSRPPSMRPLPASQAPPLQPLTSGSSTTTSTASTNRPLIPTQEAAGSEYWLKGTSLTGWGCQG